MPEYAPSVVAGGARGKKARSPRGLAASGASLDEIRQHLLSHFWYYHRLEELNYRVRDGNGCGLFEIVTGK